MLLKDLFYCILFHLTCYFKRKGVVKRLFPWHTQSYKNTWMKSCSFSVSIKTDKIICCRFYSLGTSMQIFKEALEKMGYLFQWSQTGTVELLELSEFVLNRNFRMMNNLCWYFQMSSDVSTILPKYFKRKMNQIWVLFQFLQKHIHIQFLLFELPFLSFCFTLHIIDICVPCSKVTSSDFHFQNC